MKSFPRHGQKGSALFMILIAVVLFAALSYSVIQMMRGGSPATVTSEKSGLFASEIMNYGRGLAQAVQNVKISSGCKDADISFENPEVAGYTHAPPVADGCKIFNSAGGGMNYLAPADEWLDLVYSPAPAMRGEWYFPANTCVPGTGTAPAGGCRADAADNEALIAILPFIRREVCIELNKQLGVGTPGDEPPQEADDGWPVAETKFTGAFTDGQQLDFANHAAGCFKGVGIATPPDDSYHFYQVLLPR